MERAVLIAGFHPIKRTKNVRRIYRMGFLRDLAESQVAVDALLDFLIESGHTAHELEGKKEQKSGDIRIYTDGNLKKPIDIEVKFDKRSQRSGNLCFELANNKGLTGISITKADRVAYVCPVDDGYDVFLFVTQTLKDFLFDISNADKIKIKNGGDGKRFSLAIVKIHTIIEEKLFSERWKLDK